MTIGVYQIRNVINDKKYVGSSKNIESRFRVHKSRLRKNKHHSKHLQNSYNLAPDSFVFEIIEITDNPSILESIEQYWVDLHKTYDNSFGYNAVKSVSRTDPTRQRERWAKPGQKEAQSIKMKAVCASKDWKESWKKGFNATYDTEEKKREFIESKLLSSPHRKKVIHIETGNIYESIAQAAKGLGVSVVKIRDSATGKRKSSGGMSFKWIDNV